MTDTGQVPGEGLPENAGMVEQPGVPGAYTYLSETPAEDEDLLLLPGAQSPWGNEVAPPAPEPVVETLHEPGPHEMAGRDSGAHDLSAVRTPQPQAPTVPIPPITPRRPLHLGPPIPDSSASPVRSLADRGPAGAPVRQPVAAGPEYFDAPQPQGAVPWGAPTAVQTPVSAAAPAAETVVPAPAPVAEPVGAAQAAVARPASEAGAVGHAPQEQAPAAVPEAVHETAPEPLPGPETGAVTDLGPDGEQAVSAEAAPVVAEEPGPGQLPGDGDLPEAVPAVEGDAADAGQLPRDQDVPVTDPAAIDGLVPTQEQEQVPAAEPVAEGAQVGEGAEPAPESSPVVLDGDTDSAAPHAAAPVAADAVPEGNALPETAVAAEAAAAAEAAEAPEEAGATEEADTVAEAVVPETAAVAEAAVPPVAEIAHEVTAAPEADAVQEAAPETLQVPETPQAPEADASQEPVPAPLAEEALTAPEATAPETPLPAQDAEGAEDTAPATTPAVSEAVPLPDPTETEPTAQPTEPAAPVELAPPAEEPAVAEPLPEQLPEPAHASHHVEDPQAALLASAAVGQNAPEPTVAPESAPHPQGPQPAPQPLLADVADAQGRFAVPGSPETPGVLPSAVPMEPHPGQPLGEFVAVDGSVPTTPHLAPTPPHPLTLPEGQAAVPGPREADGDAGLVQQADDLDTRAADQEDQEAPEAGPAPGAEARRSTGPAAPAYDDAEREAVLKVMRERRDIRNGFRSDPIPHEVLLRVLEAAHTAPSVGHSQPWDFVVIRSAETRGAMHELAQRQRDAYARSLPKGRAKQFKELKIEAILDTPVNIVVTADPTRGGRHTLGRHTQPQMAPYSAALAVENLWLAARAEGLGVGWVSFFDEREMVRALGLPEHLEVIAYLCVGYVDEFPDEPELMQAGWSKRRPLSWVVHEETYGRRALPGEEPHDLLGETVAQIRPLDAKALGEAWERQKRMTKPAGALGMLEIISAQLSGLSRQCPPPIPEPAAVAIFAGDHGVHAQGVTPWPQEVTAQMVANFLGGGAVCNAFAGQVGAEVCVVDVGVAAELPATPGLLPRKIRAGTSDMTTGPAMTREEAKQAIEVGIETARDLVAAGNKALLTGEMGIANTTASAALISVFTGTDPAEVTGRGTGINDETLARKTEVVRRAIEVHQPDPADPIGVLAAIGGFEHAAMVGLLLGGASLRTPVILDGVSAGAAALVARAIAPEVLAACIAGHRSAEPGHVAALNKLGLRPLVDLDLRLGEGTGALLALPLVQSTARAMHEVATFDSAGVTEK
ncbi:nicotinate-nucleotide--dimethylbenzimidazole phosphoribosyltransferase [Streptomyces griseorubiginosus]|uniref:nicotinate-nucleotide--dimethylbenzimidazole phosphoribosyltransferase n=1 Tax=Streptomyces griseorubiginosus TaxID=67304 RepID=UPI003638A1E4